MKEKKDIIKEIKNIDLEDIKLNKEDKKLLKELENELSGCGALIACGGEKTN